MVLANVPSQTVTSWALSYMMHQLLHWPSCFDKDLWPFALDHAVTMWNNLPRTRSGLSPLELFTRTKLPRHDLILNHESGDAPSLSLTRDYKMDINFLSGLRSHVLECTLDLLQFILMGLDASSASARDAFPLNVTSSTMKLFSSVQGRLTEDLLDHTTWTQLLTAWRTLQVH